MEKKHFHLGENIKRGGKKTTKKRKIKNKPKHHDRPKNRIEQKKKTREPAWDLPVGSDLSYKKESFKSDHFTQELLRFFMRVLG